MTGGHTALVNEFPQTLPERSLRRFKWISCMLHSCVQFHVSLVIGGHSISAVSAKMVSSGVKLGFATLALWQYGMQSLLTSAKTGALILLLSQQMGTTDSRNHQLG